ncbi:MAG: PaaI family thioesterase [Deltaproteobacteria bacterium]|nr:PaaI family thioesterase [Deltaproteobacteria bacterium]
MDKKKKQVYFRMVEEEPYAKLLNIKLKDVDEGYALCEMEYTERMDNLYGLAHGGAIFSLIDEAFEISSNSHENVAVALNMNVTYIRPPKKHTTLKAESKEIHRSKRTASYYITVKDDENLLAVCQAIVYIKDQEIPFLGHGEKE